ncbi:MAG TPA: phosphatidylserine decarboxylase [Candidatus Polarisedimenticolaceae bacterium]|nr:phosphatidylserine decarboxylase [Candidatus Polarisedimenticolaceae bacterium]
MTIDRAGLPFASFAALATAAAVWWVGPWFAVAPGIATLFVVWFFRDPRRVIPSGDGLLVSPADGKVLVASRDKISVFMNVFDVHVCRTPAAGRVTTVDHVAGRFLAAWRDDAGEHNERVTIVVNGADTELRFVLIAGLIARRIVCRVHVGQRLERGDRVGLIRFGSRVEVLLPPGCEPRVRRGDRVVAGETVLAGVVPGSGRAEAR